VTRKTQLYAINVYYIKV